VVALVQPGPWTVGVLINNVFSVAGSSHRPDVNQMLLQWFVNDNMKKGYYLTTGPIVTANWNATGSVDAATGDDVPGGVWNVPFGGGIGQIRRLGFQPINWTIQFTGTRSTRRVVHRGVLSFRLLCYIRKCPRRRSQSAMHFTEFQHLFCYVSDCRSIQRA
jgi:hypothetical protein